MQEPKSVKHGTVELDGLLTVYPALDDAMLQLAKKEVEKYENKSRNLNVPGAKYHHVHPSQLIDSDLVKLYNSPEMSDLVSTAIGRKVYKIHF